MQAANQLSMCLLELVLLFVHHLRFSLNVIEVMKP